ncbi:MAG: zinc ribbon domain-containing protein [Nitrospinae bacterium]|nr:zinc ribbon domain-containing protein [Nitrospinota bacterium]
MFFIGYPLFHKKGTAFTAGSDGSFNELIHKKEAAYTAIKDLDFDYITGKLSESDYKELKKRYEIEALNILRLLDEYKNKGAVTLTKKTGDERTPFCPQCGTKTKGGDNFCFQCGARLNSVEI